MLTSIGLGWNMLLFLFFGTGVRTQSLMLVASCLQVPCHLSHFTSPGSNILYSFLYRKYMNHTRLLYPPLLVSALPLVLLFFHSYTSLFRCLIIVQWNFCPGIILVHALCSTALLALIPLFCVVQQFFSVFHYVLLLFFFSSALSLHYNFHIWVHVLYVIVCKRDSYCICFLNFNLFLLLLYWEYILTFSKDLTTYHNRVDALHHTPLTSSPHSWNSFNKSHFSFLCLSLYCFDIFCYC
jgi:hypothetical protein